MTYKVADAHISSLKSMHWRYKNSVIIHNEIMFISNIEIVRDRDGDGDRQRERERGMERDGWRSSVNLNYFTDRSII